MDLPNAQLSPKRHWRGPRSQEMGRGPGGGGGGGRGGGGGAEGKLYLALHCHHQNDFCSKSHFMLHSLCGAKPQVGDHTSQLFEEKGEPKW